MATRVRLSRLLASVYYRASSRYLIVGDSGDVVLRRALTRSLHATANCWRRLRGRLVTVRLVGAVVATSVSSSCYCGASARRVLL